MTATSLDDKATALAQVVPPADHATWIIPTIPARPGRPAGYREVADPPRRRRGLQHDGTRLHFLHAIHHIELSAIDLAALQCLRSPGMPRAYHEDFLRVAAEEVGHARMLGALLRSRDLEPGSLPVHFRLWDAALQAEDAGEQLVVIPRFLEARGLDVTAELLPRMAAIDAEAAAVLQRIYDDEIGHVALGSRWHEHWCQHHGLRRADHFAAVCRRHFPDQLPSVQALDEAGRRRAGFADEELDLLRR